MLRLEPLVDAAKAVPKQYPAAADRFRRVAAQRLLPRIP